MTNVYWPPSEPDTLGPLIGADDVRDAIKTVLDTWTPYYLGVISNRLQAAGTLQTGKYLPAFGEWVNEQQYRPMSTGQPAAYLVTCAGTVGTPQLGAEGTYRATWRAQVSIQVFGTDWQEAADRTSWYEKAVRWAILKNRALGGLANATAWAGVAYDGKLHDSTRTEGIATLGLDVEVLDVVSVLPGPATVPTNFDPPPTHPTVESTAATITRGPDTKPLP